jgi:hypothetical protein
VDADLVVEEAGGRDDLLSGHGGDLVLLHIVHSHCGAAGVGDDDIPHTSEVGTGGSN